MGGMDDGVDAFVAFGSSGGEEFLSFIGGLLEVIEEKIAVLFENGEGFGVGGVAFGEEVAVGESVVWSFLEHALGEVAGGFEEGNIIH